MAYLKVYFGSSIFANKSVHTEGLVLHRLRVTFLFYILLIFQGEDKTSDSEQWALLVPKFLLDFYVQWQNIKSQERAVYQKYSDWKKGSTENLYLKRLDR